jgi:hypothetical protein
MASAELVREWVFVRQWIPAFAGMTRRCVNDVGVRELRDGAGMASAEFSWEWDA